MSGLVEFIQHHGSRKLQDMSGGGLGVLGIGTVSGGGGHSLHAAKYKISMCRDLTTRGSCPRGANCTFAHSEEELDKLVDFDFH